MKIEHALEKLNSLIDAGYEFQEGHWQVMQQFNLTKDEGVELTKLYDEQG